MIVLFKSRFWRKVDSMRLFSLQISRSIVKWTAAAAMAAALLPGLLPVAAPPAAAEPVFTFATTPGALPKVVVPVHYALDLTPDFDKLTFAGSELIDIDVTEPTSRVVLNAADLTIEAAAVDGEAASSIAFQASQQTVTFAFPHPIEAGRHQLRVAFSGRFDRTGSALFVVDYTAAGGRKQRMISSHLEPADARRMFPGFDEPAFKASFTLTVTMPQAFMAVSNMPVAGEQPAGEGRKRVAFQPTPRMSSYLLTLTVGDLERVTADVDGVTVGVVTKRGKSGQGRYALEIAADTLRYYNTYFGVAYPLPKLDLIAVPGGRDRAMENWGGVTFYESRLLLDPAKASEEARRTIFTFVAHEIAHQWFGDLVTMAWWDNIWLNEGFASWMEAKAAEVLHPDWQSWLDGGPVSFRQSAMNDDAGRASHPIQRPVANETEAMAAFDSISYGKGQAVVHMLENYVGEDAFRAGIRAYIAKHAYSNTTTADLWEALQAASGKPVTAVASGFTEQAGIPLVVAQASCAAGDVQRVTLRQERFTTRDAASNDPASKDAPVKPVRWHVPVTRSGTGGAEESLLLDGATEFTAGRCGDPVKLNFGAVGYYRVQYDTAMYGALARVIDRLTPADRANLVNDTWAMVETGRVPPDAFLGLIDRLAGDDNRAVADIMIRALTRIERLQWNRPERAAFRTYGRAMLRPLFDRIGWDAAPSEPGDYPKLRTRLIDLLATFGDEAIVAEGKRRFAKSVGDPASLTGALRETVVSVAGRNADRATYDALLALARGASQPGERQRYYVAAASARDLDLARETLALTLTDELPAGGVSSVIATVASAGERRDLAWSFVKENYPKLVARQKGSSQDNFISSLLMTFTDAAHAEELVSFAEAHKIAAGPIVTRAYVRMMADAEFSAQLPTVDAWVKKRMVQR
jgi:aminopeptidase N